LNGGGGISKMITRERMCRCLLGHQPTRLGLECKLNDTKGKKIGWIKEKLTTKIGHFEKI